jgi:hypothetical protein
MTTPRTAHRRPSGSIRHLSSGPRPQLARVRLARADELGHLPVAVAERLGEYVGRPFRRAEALEHREQRERHGVPLRRAVERAEARAH